MMGKIRTAAQTPAVSTWILGLILICAPAARAQSLGEVVLHSFDGTDGNLPEASLIKGSDGNFYGTTHVGGANPSPVDERGAGTVFELTPSGTLTTLYSFCSQANCTDGDGPQFAGVIQGSDGNLYGVTAYGGANQSANVGRGGGTVFELTPSGTLTTLYSFCSQANCTDGWQPEGGVIQGIDGNFYGTTGGGGANNGGTVFELTPSGTLTTLYSFCSVGSYPNCLDGDQPLAGVIQGIDGNFYGTTYGGGANPHSGFVSGGGTVFMLTPSGTLTTFYSFCGVVDPNTNTCLDGGQPYASLIQAIDGNFYGTTSEGGAADHGDYGGTVFKLTPSGTLTTLYSFCSSTRYLCTDGSEPWALIQGIDGNFYGTTFSGGPPDHVGGTVFELTPLGTLTTLYSFCGQANCTDGQAPQAGVIQGSDGNFYGTTGSGGANNDGTVFEVQALLPVKLKIEPTTLKFGTVKVGSSKGPKNITVSNPTGSKKKPGITVVMEGDGGAASPYTVSNDCGASLAAGAKCMIAVTFTPDEAGPQNATLTIFDNAKHEPQSVKLTGTGK